MRNQVPLFRLCLGCIFWFGKFFDSGCALDVSFGSERSLIQVVPWMYQESLIFTQFPCGVPYFLPSESRQRTSQGAENRD